MDTAPGYDKLTEFLDLCRQKASSATEITWTRTLLPGMSYRRGWAIHLDGTGAQIVIPIVVGSTSYQAGDGTKHHTDFVFTPGLKPAPGKYQAYRPLPTSGTIPKDDLDWHPGPAGTAD
jgi:hypothetical protein